MPHQAGKECESTEAVRQIAQAWLVKIGTVDNRQHLTPRIAASLAGSRQQAAAICTPTAGRTEAAPGVAGSDSLLSSRAWSTAWGHSGGAGRAVIGLDAVLAQQQALHLGVQPVVLVEHGGELAGEGCARCS